MALRKIFPIIASTPLGAKIMMIMMIGDGDYNESDADNCSGDDDDDTLTKAITTRMLSDVMKTMLIALMIVVMLMQMRLVTSLEQTVMIPSHGYAMLVLHWLQVCIQSAVLR